MNRIALSIVLTAGLASAGAAAAQDYQRSRAVERGEARISGERAQPQRSESRRDNGAYWNNQSENHWERDARRQRESNSRFYANDDKSYRYDDRHWQVDRGLPHSDPRYSGYRDYGDLRYQDHRVDWRDASWRTHWRHGWAGNRYRASVRYYYPQGYSRYSWRVGYTLPGAFLSSSWYVDYRPYGIAPPPYGCRWVRVDGELLLVELASGYIIDVLHDFFY